MNKMMHQKNNLIHTVEERCFRIVAPISEGSFSVVYNAEELIGDEARPVILKAFSMDPSLADRNGWDAVIRHELQMNRRIVKSGFAGALTMDYTVHELHGDHVYGVMPANQPGRTLREFVESEEYRYYTLRDRVATCKRLFQVISRFHDACGLIHGDINPNNVYIRDTDNDGEQEQNAVIALLDFGISQEIGDMSDNILGFTEGYARPAVAEGKRTNLTVMDDWYGAAACFWYCLSGFSPDEYEITVENIEHVHQKLAVRTEHVRFSNDAERQLLQLREEHYSTVQHLLEDIFLNIESLADDVIDKLDKLQTVLEDTGISRERLYASLSKEYRSLRGSRFADLDIIRRILPSADFTMERSTARFYRSRSNKPEQLQQIMNSCQESLFMVGDGGMGKTTSLISIMDDAYDESAVDIDHPVIFMELCTLSQNCEEWYSPQRGGTFIEQFIASYFTDAPRSYVPADHPYVTPLREELFRAPPKGIKQYTVLLDGLNEIGFINEKSRKVFFEVLNYYLKYAGNLRIILTGRNDAYELDTEQLQRLHTEGLNDTSIEGVLLEAVDRGRLSEQDYRRILNNRYDIATNEYRLWQCLKTPFFLMMYCVMTQKRAVTRQGEILKNFLHDKRETLDGTLIYGEKQQSGQKHAGKSYGDAHGLRMDLSIRIVLDFVIPEIALNMVEDNLFFIGLDDVMGVVRGYLQPDMYRTRCQNWRKWFYGYEINVQEVLDEINRIDGGARIPQYACELLGVMRETANGALFFTHQYFRDYFAACALINRILLVLEMKSTGVAGLHAGDTLFETLIHPFHGRKLSSYICALMGETLGEHRNLPKYSAENENWYIPSVRGQEEQLVLRRFLECYRMDPDLDRDAEDGQPINSVGYGTGLYNLFSVFKNSRVQNDGKIDFSGLSLQRLDLSNISLAGIVMSRFSKYSAEPLTADYTGSSGIVEALLRDETLNRVRCLAVHPTKRRMVLHDSGTGAVTEVDLEHGETIWISERMEAVQYASYCQENDEILFVTYLPGVPSKKRYRRTFFERLKDVIVIGPEEDDYFESLDDEEEWFDFDPYDPRGFGEGERDLEEEVRLYLFHRGRGLQLSAHFRREKLLSAHWSEAYQELSLMLKDAAEDAVIKVKQDGQIFPNDTVINLHQIKAVHKERVISNLKCNVRNYVVDDGELNRQNSIHNIQEFVSGLDLLTCIRIKLAFMFSSQYIQDKNAEINAQAVQIQALREELAEKEEEIACLKARLENTTQE